MIVIVKFPAYRAVKIEGCEPVTFFEKNIARRGAHENMKDFYEITSISAIKGYIRSLNN